MLFSVHTAAIPHNQDYADSVCRAYEMFGQVWTDTIWLAGNQHLCDGVNGNVISWFSQIGQLNWIELKYS